VVDVTTQDTTHGGEAATPGAASGRKARSGKTVVGEVVSDRMRKTISVRVQRLERHRRYHKYVRRTTTYKAHDGREEARVGDQVRIAETRPLSKTKRWRLVEIVRRSSAAPVAGREAGPDTPAEDVQ
jgi:small subunit ribosomal protein S17